MTTKPMEPSDLPAVFHDLSPVPQDDGPHPVCAIAYSDDFVRTYDYLRACLRSDELSERTLRLTALCLKLNPANYTVWHYRRRILGALSSSSSPPKDDENAASDEEAGQKAFDPRLVELDLAMAAKLGGGNPKNYQIWYHRRALLEPSFEKVGAKDDDDVMKAAREELSYVGTVLREDAKNYHAWSHRQWITRTLDSPTLWSSEKDYTHALISDDPRNNSAWNQRWFVVHNGRHVPLDPDDASSECRYALEAAALDPHNESPWRYLIGVVKEQENKEAISDLVELCHGEMAGMKTRLEENNDGEDAASAKPAACPNLLSAYADILEMKKGEKCLAEACAIVHSLAVEHDTIRRKYWAMRERQLQALL